MEFQLINFIRPECCSSNNKTIIYAISLPRYCNLEKTENRLCSEVEKHQRITGKPKIYEYGLGEAHFTKGIKIGKILYYCLGKVDVSSDIRYLPPKDPEA